MFLRCSELQTHTYVSDVLCCFCRYKYTAYLENACCHVTGNSRTQVNYLGAASSTKHTLKDSNKDYKDLVVESSQCPPQFQPRNQQKVKYFRAQARETHKIGRDAIINLHELAFMLISFVWSISTFPTW